MDLKEFKTMCKERFESAETLEELEKSRKEIFEVEIPEFSDEGLDKDEEFHLRVYVAQMANLRFHELNDSLEFKGESSGVLNPKKVLPIPGSTDVPKKLIQREKKVIMI